MTHEVPPDSYIRFRVPSPTSPSPIRPFSSTLNCLRTPQQALIKARVDLLRRLPYGHALGQRVYNHAGKLLTIQPPGRRRGAIAARVRRHTRDKDDPCDWVAKKHLFGMWNGNWERREDVSDWNRAKPKMQRLKKKFRLEEVMWQWDKDHKKRQGLEGAAQKEAQKVQWEENQPVLPKSQEPWPSVKQESQDENEEVEMELVVEEGAEAEMEVVGDSASGGDQADRIDPVDPRLLQSFTE